MSVRTVPGALDILNQKLGGNAGDIPASSTKEYALEKIYRTLGGEETLEGVNTTSEIIEKIAGVAEGGGGGSSDFSTAEVTIDITLDGGAEIDSVFIGNVSIAGYPNSTDPYTTPRVEVVNNKATIVLYQGRAVIEAVLAYDNNNNEYIVLNPTLSGNVTRPQFVYLVSGDCTISGVATLNGN